MSEVQMAYIAMVVAGMASFLVVLAWGCFYTRGANTAGSGD